MNNLIKDLMKLDLAKFSKPRGNSKRRRGSCSTNISENQNDLKISKANDNRNNMF